VALVVKSLTQFKLYVNGVVVAIKYFPWIGGTEQNKSLYIGRTHTEHPGLIADKSIDKNPLANTMHDFISEYLSTHPNVPKEATSLSLNVPKEATSLSLLNELFAHADKVFLAYRSNRRWKTPTRQRTSWQQYRFTELFDYPLKIPH